MPTAPLTSMVPGISKAPRLVSIHTHPLTTRVLLRGQLAFLREQGFDVTAIAAPGPALAEVEREEGVATIGVPMERELSPVRDFVSLLRMFFVLRRLRPQIVHAGTPKAALLGMLAAWTLRVPVRIYALKGLRLETLRGMKYHVMAFVERVTAGCATRVFCESPSLRKAYVEGGFASLDKAMVIGPGLPNGLDATRYEKGVYSDEQTAALRSKLGIPAGAPVIGFVGRFVRDKGMVELCDAFESILQHYPEVRLLLVGDFEAGDPVPADYVQRIVNHPQIVRTGFLADTAPYYPLLDVLAFPSYHEGFPNVPMEAAAAEVPTVGYRATGTVDAVLDGVTGTIVDCGDAAALRTALLRYFDDPELRRRHGAAARLRVTTEFRREPIWNATIAEYRRLLAEQGVPAPCLAARETPAG